MPDLADVVGRLYGLPLEEFTRERDAAARELRKAKERDAAAAVAKLPKPSQASWAGNTLARERRDLVDALLRHGGCGLQEACARAIEGLARLGGDGGLIAVSAHGEVAATFNSSAMTRGWRVGDGPVVTAIGPDEGA